MLQGVETTNRRGSKHPSRRAAAQAAFDACAWLIALPIAAELRYEGNLPAGALTQSITFGLLAAAAQVFIGYAFRLYRGRYRFGSFDEVLGVTTTVALVTAITFIVRATVQAQGGSRSVPLIAGVIALSLMLGVRFTIRAHRTRRNITQTGERTLIYGAGDSGEQLLEQMLRSTTSDFTPVGFIDDDPSKRHLRIYGQRVKGTNADIERVIAATGATTLVVAMAKVEAAFLLDLDRRCQARNVSLRVIPSTSEIIGGAVTLGDISHVREEDLLGRRPIHTDEAAISAFIKNKRVLITGAGGSIGSELARQVHRYQPAQVFMLDRDESGLHATQLSIDGHGLLDTDALILADIRDAERMLQVMQLTTPDIVIHAAALKHLTFLQRYPDEAHKTNVLGTQNVIQAAQAVGTDVFVNISTDKAADPTCVLGQTKLTTERMVASIEPINGERFMSVRFGNVLGSRGSVLTTFRYQIEKGGPVTVTHPDVTRYFMTIPEAVHLVLQAAVIGKHRETMILDMGQPVKILDVANHMIAKSGRSIDIVFTGLRDGEKADEVLVSSTETTERREHPLIMHTHVTNLMGVTTQ